MDIPALVSEQHVCHACELSYIDVSVDQALAMIASVPVDVRAAVVGIPNDRLRERAAHDTWSILEYVCHLRDVYVAYTIRLHRALYEDGPVLEPMLNDLRARRFGYNDRALDPMLDELDAAVAGFLAEAAAVPDHQWQRVVTRRPGERRTARWLLRQAAHEGLHHLEDIRTISIGHGRTPE